MGKSKETTKERVRAGVCLHCESAEHQRGLCVKHYMQFRRTMLALPKKQQADFELAQINSENILAAGHVRILTTDNPFLGAGK
jgi:hypothetical protein